MDYVLKFTLWERPIFFALDKNEKIPQSYEKVQKNLKISGKIWKMITIRDFTGLTYNDAPAVYSYT